MVFEIAAPPKDKRVQVYEGIRMQNVDTQELPYVSDEFFQILFANLSVNTIISIFPHMLCQTSIIIAVKDMETLVPIHQALNSLIYPFVYPISAPCVHNDDQSDDDDNEMSHVITICPVFNGILEADIKLAERIIKSNQLPTPPLMIDLTKRDDQP